MSVLRDLLLAPVRAAIIYSLRPRRVVWAHTAALYAQPFFRGKNDTGGEASADWIAAENANFSVGLDSNFRVRFKVDDTVGSDANGVSGFKLQYNVGGAGWNDVTAASSFVRSSLSGNFTDGVATTQQLTAAGTFIAGSMDEGDGAATSAAVIQGNAATELEFCVQVRSADWTSGTIQLRVVVSDGTVFAGTYVVPTITVQAFDPDVIHYRVYNDDGSEATSTPIAAEDAAATVPAQFGSLSSIVHLRLMVQAQNVVGGAATDDYQLQYEKNDSGTWANVNAASADVASVASANLTDGAATTDRGTNGLTNPGAGAFVAGEQEDVDGLVTDHQLTGSNFTEHVWALQLDGNDVANGDNLDFRLLLNGVAMTMAVTPRITVSQTNPTISSASMGDAGRNFEAPFQDVVVNFSETIDGAPAVDAVIPGLTVGPSGTEGVVTYISGDGTAQWTVRRAALAKNGDAWVIDYAMASGVLLAVDDNAELRETADAAVTNNLTKKVHETLKRGDTGAVITAACSFALLDAEPRDADDAAWMAVFQRGHVTPDGAGIIDITVTEASLVVGDPVYLAVFNPREDATGTAEAYARTTVAVVTVT